MRNKNKWYVRETNLGQGIVGSFNFLKTLLTLIVCYSN